MRKEEIEKGDCGPPTRKGLFFIYFWDFVGLEPSGTCIITSLTRVKRVSWIHHRTILKRVWPMMHLHTRCLNVFFLHKNLNSHLRKTLGERVRKNMNNHVIAALLEEQGLRNPTNILYGHFVEDLGGGEEGGGISHQVCPVTDRRITLLGSIRTLPTRSIATVSAWSTPSVSARSTPLVSAQSSTCCHLDWPHGVCYANIILCMPTFKRGAAKASGDTRLSTQRNLQIWRRKKDWTKPTTTRPEILRKSAWSDRDQLRDSTLFDKKFEKENTIMNISQASSSWTTLHCTTCFLVRFTTNRALPTCGCGGQLISNDFAAITLISTVHTICSTGLLVLKHSPMTLWRKRRGTGLQCPLPWNSKQAWAANVSQGIPRRSLLRR